MQHGTLVTIIRTLCGSQAVLVDGIDLSVYMYTRTRSGEFLVLR